MGTATVQGALWGRQSKVWAELQEPSFRPWFSATLDALGPLKGRSLLDAGCGAGLLLRLAADRGATVAGVDAARGMLDAARDRVPEADLREGDIEELPFDSNSFDAVTAFNSIQYAASPQNAVCELRRVTRPGGRVAVCLWGDPARCETEGLFAALRQLAPPPPGAPAPLALSGPGQLEAFLAEAGLETVAAGEVDHAFEWADLETAWRAMTAAGPIIHVIGVAGQERTKEAVVGAFRPYRRPDGSVRQRNVFRYVVTRA